MTSSPPTAAILIIGNEILTGRTADSNLNTIAKKMFAAGIVLTEARVVRDIEVEIIAAINALRDKSTYVFTTGGIGPTHDDITVDAIAKAFGKPVIESPEARAILLGYYGEDKINPARLRMARIPEGASLIHNPLTAAPGVHVGNVYIMAGVPSIMTAMLDGIVATLRHGPKIHTMTVTAAIGESVIAEELATIAGRYPELEIGSYPWMKMGTFGTALVARGVDLSMVEAAANEIKIVIEGRGIIPTLSVD